MPKKAPGFDRSFFFVKTESSLSPQEIAFFDAAVNGDARKVCELIGSGISVDVRDNRQLPWEETALMQASLKGHAEVVKVLLAAGADVSAKDKHLPESPGENQPLHYAAAGGNVDVIKQLLIAGADPNALNTAGHTPLNIAIQHGHLEAVQLLIANGANVKTRPKKKRYFPPLCVAASAKQVEIFFALLKAGAEVNAVNPLNQTALNCAAAVPEDIAIPMVEALLKARAEVDHVDKFGETPLSEAVFQHSHNVVKLLVKSGADVNRVFKSHGGTLLDAAEIRFKANARTAEDESEPKCIREEAALGAQQWCAMFELLRELGGKKQSELSTV